MARKNKIQLGIFRKYYNSKGRIKYGKYKALAMNLYGLTLKLLVLYTPNTAAKCQFIYVDHPRKIQLYKAWESQPGSYWK